MEPHHNIIITTNFCSTCFTVVPMVRAIILYSFLLLYYLLVQQHTTPLTPGEGQGHLKFVAGGECVVVECGRDLSFVHCSTY